MTTFNAVAAMIGFIANFLEEQFVAFTLIPGMALGSVVKSTVGPYCGSGNALLIHDEFTPQPPVVRDCGSYLGGFVMVLLKFKQAR